MNALIPSRASGDRTASAWPSASASTPSAKDRSNEALSWALDHGKCTSGPASEPTRPVRHELVEVGIGYALVDEAELRRLRPGHTRRQESSSLARPKPTSRGTDQEPPPSMPRPRSSNSSPNRGCTPHDGERRHHGNVRRRAPALVHGPGLSARRATSQRPSGQKRRWTRTPRSVGGAPRLLLTRMARGRSRRSRYAQSPGCHSHDAPITSHDVLTF